MKAFRQAVLIWMELAIVQKHSPPFGFLSVSNKSVKRKRKATTNMNANEPKDGMSHVTKKSHKHPPSSLSFQWPNETKRNETHSKRWHSSCLQAIKTTVLRDYPFWEATSQLIWIECIKASNTLVCSIFAMTLVCSFEWCYMISFSHLFLSIASESDTYIHKNNNLRNINTFA